MSTWRFAAIQHDCCVHVRGAREGVGKDGGRDQRGVRLLDVSRGGDGLVDGWLKVFSQSPARTWMVFSSGYVFRLYLPCSQEALPATVAMWVELPLQYTWTDNRDC